MHINAKKNPFKSYATGNFFYIHKPHISTIHYIFQIINQIYFIFRFLELYPLHSRIVNAEIHLDATAQRLGVEKRRIYDIINILEALQCATHRRKNTYTWHGSSKLGQFLTNLKAQGESVGVSHPLHGRKKYQSVPKRRSLGDLAQRFLMMFLVEPPVSSFNSFSIFIFIF